MGKKIFLITLLIMTFNSMYSQKNTYKLERNIKITYISLIKMHSSVYANGKLISLDLVRENDSISHVTKIYNTDSQEERFNKTPTKIKTSTFDKIVHKLNQLDINKTGLDFNIADGIIYSLSFGDSKYTISLDANTASENEQNSKLYNFLETFNFIWKQFEE